MDSKINFTNTPTVIRTSKQWVLPPRPRPGRKPHHHNASSSSSSSSSPQPKKEPKKQYKKKSDTSKINNNNNNNNNTQNNANDIQFNNNPIELALKSIKDENQSLRLELSRLVADLKSLQEHEESDLHKKRNHLEMENSSSMPMLHANDSEDYDDSSSQISTPSLVSTTSSMTSESLESVQEEGILKIDDFLTTSFFECGSSNSITNSNAFKEDQLNSINIIDLPPSLPQMIDSNNDSYEFNFLKQESLKDASVFRNDDFDSLFQTNDQAIDNEFWDWK